MVWEKFRNIPPLIGSPAEPEIVNAACVEPEEDTVVNKSSLDDSILSTERRLEIAEESMLLDTSTSLTDWWFTILSIYSIIYDKLNIILKYFLVNVIKDKCKSIKSFLIQISSAILAFFLYILSSMSRIEWWKKLDWTN